MTALGHWTGLGIVAGALLATSAAWADETLPALKDIPRVAHGTGSPSAATHKLPPSVSSSTSSSKPGDAARSVLAHEKHAKPSPLPTLIAERPNAWTAHESASGQQVTSTLFSGDGIATMDSNGTTIIFAPQGTLYQNVTLAPGQQYLVEVALRTDCASGQMTMTSQNDNSQQSAPIPGPSETKDIHVLFNYTFQKGLQNIDSDQLIFNVGTNASCNGYELDAIAYVPFNPVD